MSENPSNDNSLFAKSENKWNLSPKEFIFRYLYVLPWIVICVAIALVMAYVKIRYTVQIFEAHSSLLIKEESQNPLGKDEKLDELFMSQGSLNLPNEVEILRSRPVLARVARDMDLQYQCYNKGKVRSTLIYPEHPFTLTFLSLTDSTLDYAYNIEMVGNGKYLLDESKTPIAFGDVVERGNLRFKIDTTAGTSFAHFGSKQFILSHLSVAGATEQLAGGLKVQQPGDQTTILRLSFDSESPTLAMQLLNTLMAVYDTLVVEDKTRISANTLKFINERLYELNDTLKGVQGVLRNFMVSNQVFDIEGQSKSYLEAVGESDKTKVEQGVKLSIVDWLLDYVGNKKNVYELVPTNLGIEEPTLQQMVLQYNTLQLERDRNLRTTSENSQLVQGLNSSLEKVRNGIFQALTNVKQAYLIAQSRLNRENSEIQNKISGLPGKSMQMLNMERQQKILEELYSLLLQKQIETSISSASAISNSKVIEPALSSSIPVGPDRKKTYTTYFMLGLLIPLGITVLREMLKDRVSSRADVEKNTETPILGEIGHSEGTNALVVTPNSRRFISEQFRIIRTNLQYVLNKYPKPVIMVTSSFSGEGKSFISTNIGSVMSLSGKKTVIMEFDIRKPKIISGLDLKRKMGITNYIIGKASFEDLLIKVEGVDNLYVIPCGPIPPNPSELLLDSRLDELMAEVFEAFECVIMDTAPVGLVSDAIILSKYANCSLYIVRHGHTFRKQLGMIQELFTSQKLPHLYLILNDVAPQGGYYGGYYGGGYGYYGGYGYGHGSGYFEDDGKKRRRKGVNGLMNRFKKWFS